MALAPYQHLEKGEQDDGGGDGLIGDNRLKQPKGTDSGSRVIGGQEPDGQAGEQSGNEEKPGYPKNETEGRIDGHDDVLEIEGLPCIPGPRFEATAWRGFRGGSNLVRG